MGDPRSDLLTILSTLSWKILSTNFLKTSLCALGTGYGVAWYGLEPGFISMSTGLVIQVPNIPSKRNSYLVNQLCSARTPVTLNVSFLTRPYIGGIFHSNSLRCNVCVAWNPAHVCSPIIICSESFFH